MKNAELAVSLRKIAAGGPDVFTGANWPTESPQRWRRTVGSSATQI
jgi:hypothetical protein